MKIGFIGTGNMGGAILSGITKTSVHDLYAYDLDAKKMDALDVAYPIHKEASVSDVISKSDYIFICVKPYHIEHLLKEHEGEFKNKTIISIALGWNLEKYIPLVDDTTEVLCIMPNTPCQVLAGVFLFNTTKRMSADSFESINELLKPLGEVVLVEERLMNVAGSLTGCGPAFIYMVIEGLADGAVKHGLPRAQAYDLASAMVLGSAKTVLETKQHPAKLKDDVCSPGGSTIEGVEALYKGNLHAIMMAAIEAAVKH